MCYGPLSSFQVDFFSQYGTLSFWQIFFTPKTPFFGPSWTWNDTWIGHKSVPSIYFHCLRCVMAHYHVSRLNFPSNMASCHFGCFLPPKPPIFGPTWTWNDTWMGLKVPKTSLPIAWGVFWANIQFPGWIFCSIWHPVILAIFEP